jgi:uncharacterized protein YndB with AHSA1/START domain
MHPTVPGSARASAQTHSPAGSGAGSAILSAAGAAGVARASTTSDVFNAVADVHRREILDALITGEKPVGAIVNDLSMSQPQVSNTCVCSVRWDSLGAGRRGLVGFVMDGDAATCSFRGTYLEIERPVRLVGTWVFDGRPDANAVETVEPHEEDGVTTMTDRLAFRDRATRDSMTWAAADGVHSDEGGQVGWDRLEDYLATLA